MRGEGKVRQGREEQHAARRVIKRRRQEGSEGSSEGRDVKKRRAGRSDA